MNYKINSIILVILYLIITSSLGAQSKTLDQAQIFLNKTASEIKKNQSINMLYNSILKDLTKTSDFISEALLQAHNGKSFLCKQATTKAMSHIYKANATLQKSSLNNQLSKTISQGIIKTITYLGQTLSMFPTTMAADVTSGQKIPSSNSPSSPSIPKKNTSLSFSGYNTHPIDSSQFFYFNYDDSASQASVELVKYQLSLNKKPNPSLARVWEFLNYEEFLPEKTEKLGLFDISMGLIKRASSVENSLVTEYKLGVSVASPQLTKASRKNVALTLVVDVSGSMSTRTIQISDSSTKRMDLVHHGLNYLINSLKEGDIINIVCFDTDAKIRHQNLMIPADLQVYKKAVLDLKPEGSTNLNAGIVLGYQAALDSYDPEKSNCVIMLTDAHANTGEIDPKIIAENVRINDSEGIHFSGLGISSDFNDAFLNELTDIGKGAYFSIITPSDARRTFEQRFEALLNVAAKDVKFRLDFPESLVRDVTASEESSSDESKVSSTNFSFNTNQYFFEGFKSDSSQLKPEDSFKLTVSYTNPMNGIKTEKYIEHSVKELLGKDENLIRDAEVIYLFTELLAKYKKGPDIEAFFNTHYLDYESSLFTEYQSLIKRYLSIKEIMSKKKVPKKLKKKQEPRKVIYSQNLRNIINRLSHASASAAQVRWFLKSYIDNNSSTAE